MGIHERQRRQLQLLQLQTSFLRQNYEFRCPFSRETILQLCEGQIKQCSCWLLQFEELPEGVQRRQRHESSPEGGHEGRYHVQHLLRPHHSGWCNVGPDCLLPRIPPEIDYLDKIVNFSPMLDALRLYFLNFNL